MRDWNYRNEDLLESPHCKYSRRHYLHKDKQEQKDKTPQEKNEIH